MANNVRLPLFTPDADAAHASNGAHVSRTPGEARDSRDSSGARPLSLEGDALASPDTVASPDTITSPEDGELMQIGDLAKEAGKTVRAIHLYEELNLLKPAARSKGRYRLYSRDALTRIRWIGKLQDMGFSLTDIQSVVKDWETGGSASGAMRKMREVYAKKLEETRAHLRRLEALEREIEASIHYLDTCDVCDPERLLGFCRACDLHGCEQHVPELVAGFRASCS